MKAMEDEEGLFYFASVRERSPMDGESQRIQRLKCRHLCPHTLGEKNTTLFCSSLQFFLCTTHAQPTLMERVVRSYKIRIRYKFLIGFSAFLYEIKLLQEI